MQRNNPETRPLLSENMQESTRRVLPRDISTEIQLLLISILRLITYSSLIVYVGEAINDTLDTSYEKDDSVYVASVFSRLILPGIMVLTALVAAYKQHQDLNFHSKSVKTEMDRNSLTDTEEGHLIELDDNEPFTVKKRFQLNDGTNQMIQWEIGKGEIYSHSINLIKFFDEFRKHHHQEFEIPKTPAQFTSRMRPYTTRNCDMPTKARYFELLGLVGLTASGLYSLYFKLPYPIAAPVIMAYTLLTIAASARESDLLRRLDLQLNAEGFYRRYPCWCACPPTCIGQQMTAKLFFRPQNSTLKEIVEYISLGEKILKALQDSESTIVLTQKEKDLLADINHRFTMTDDEEMQLDVVRSRFSINRPD